MFELFVQIFLYLRCILSGEEKYLNQERRIFKLLQRGKTLFFVEKEKLCVTKYKN